jgi:hypothetical protein
MWICISSIKPAAEVRVRNVRAASQRNVHSVRGAPGQLDRPTNGAVDEELIKETPAN